MNPYYNPQDLGLEMISFDEPNLFYEYSTLCFWATSDGRIYSASDSGCSCPTPFEDNHDRPTKEEVIQTLEQVGSIEQAEAIYDAWNASYIPGQTKLNESFRKELTTWVKSKLKSAQ